MKRILSFLLLSFALLQIWADDVSQQQAQAIAMQFVSDNTQSQEVKAMRGTRASTPQLTLAYVGRSAATTTRVRGKHSNSTITESPASFYIFNCGGDSGWVIVSGSETTVAPILAFSDKGNFSYDTASENMRWILSRYTDIIEKARSQGLQPQWSTLRAAPKRPNIIVKPLLPRNYNQWSPYNDQCPVVEGKRCPTGCVATAVAQIMRYWQWPKHGMGAHTNTSPTGEHRDFNHAYTWDDSPEALATLLADVGTACDMQYSPNESGAYPNLAMEALIRYFRYSDDAIGYACTDETMREELDAKRPMLYVGHKYVDMDNFDPFNPPPTSSRDSHAFVCDGYAEQGFFHFNLGWGGHDNGWFRTNAILLTIDDYSMKSGGIYRLQPSYKPRFEKNGILYEIESDKYARLIRAYDQEVITIASQVEWEGKIYETSKTIAESQFAHLKAVKQVIIGEGITTIAPYAFAQSDIEQVTFPSTLTLIDRYAFLDCNAIKAITIAPQTTIAPNAFRSCKGLKDIFIEDGVQSIADSVFISCGVENLRLPKDIKIGKRAFCSCNKLKTIDNLAFVKAVGDGAFLGCPIITAPQLKFEAVEHIGNGAFENTNIARKVILPAATRFVGTRAFAFRSITHVPSVFEGYVVDEGNPMFAHNKEGMLLSKDKTVLFCCPQGDVVPEGVERIASQAFYQPVSNITLPNTLQEIDSLVFHHYDIRNVRLHASTPPRTHPLALAGGKPYPYTKLYVPEGAMTAYKYAPIWNTFGEIVDDLAPNYTPPLPVDSALACYVYKKVGNTERRFDFDMNVFSIYVGELMLWDETTNDYKTVPGYTINGNPINGSNTSFLQFTFDESVRIGYVVPSTINDVVWTLGFQKADEDSPSTTYPTTHKGELLLENGNITIKDASGHALGTQLISNFEYIFFNHDWSPSLRQFTIKWEEHHDFGYGPYTQQREEKCPYYRDGDWKLHTNDDGTQTFNWGTGAFNFISLNNMHSISMPQNKMSNPVREKYRFLNVVDKNGNEESLPLSGFDEVVFKGNLIHLADKGRTVHTFEAPQLKRMYLSRKSVLELNENQAQLMDDEPQHLYLHIGNTWKEVGMSRVGNIFTDGASLFIDSIGYPLNAIDSITFVRPNDAVLSMQNSSTTYAISPLCPEVKTQDYALRFSASALTNESRVKVTPIYPSALATMEGVRSVKAYDITLDHKGTGESTHQLHGVVEIRIPFTKHEGYDVVASYYNEADSVQDWRPICHHYDSVRQEMVILSSHLTKFGIFDIDHEHSRNAKITDVRFYELPSLDESAQETANNILELAQRVTERPNETKAVLDWMAEKYSTASTFGLDMGYNFAQSLGYSSELLNDFDDHIAFVGATVAAYQVYSAALDGKMETVAGGTMSLALNQMTTYAGKFLGGPIWAASMFSVAVINYSLTQFGETAWKGRTDKYRAAYHTYYTQGEPGYRSQADWVSTLWPVVHNKQLTKERLDAAIDNLVRRHCDKFWTIGGDEQAHYIANTGLWWTGWGGLNEKMEQTISDEYRAELYRTDIKQAIETICDSMRWEAYDEGCRAMERYRKLMNKVITISFTDGGLQNDSSIYAGCTVRFADLPATIEDPKLWETKLDKQGKGHIQFRIFAQVYNHVEPRLVVVDDKGDIVKRLSLELNYKTHVDLSQDNTLGFDPKYPEDVKLNVVMTPDSIGLDDRAIMQGGIWLNSLDGEGVYYREHQASFARWGVCFRELYGDIAQLMTEHSALLAQAPSANTRIEVPGLSLIGTYDAKTKTGSGQFTLKSDYEAKVVAPEEWLPFPSKMLDPKLLTKVRMGRVVFDGQEESLFNALLGGHMTHQLSGTYEVRQTLSGRMVYTFKGAGTYHLDAQLFGGYDYVDFDMFRKLIPQPEVEVIVKDATYEGQCTIDQSFVFGK